MTQIARAFFFAFVLLLTTSSFAQKQVAIPNFEIQLKSADGRSGPRQTTSQDGTFSFDNLAEGTYTVYISPKQVEQATLLMPALMKAKEKANRTKTASSTAGGTTDGDSDGDSPQASFSLNFTKIEMCYIKQDDKSSGRQASLNVSASPGGSANGKRIFNWTGIFDESAAPQIVVEKKGGSLSGEMKGSYDLKTMTK